MLWAINSSFSWDDICPLLAALPKLLRVEASIGPQSSLLVLPFPVEHGQTSEHITLSMAFWYVASRSAAYWVEQTYSLNFLGVIKLPEVKAKNPRMINIVPVIKVTIPNGTAKQALFLLIHMHQPFRAVSNTNTPIIKTGRAYPDLLISIYSPKFIDSGGTIFPVWKMPIIIIHKLRANIAVATNAMYELQH